MQITHKNLLHFANPESWRCSVIEVSESGNVTVSLLYDPPGRSRLQLVVRDTIYLDAFGDWLGCDVHLASKETFEEFIPNLGETLINHIGNDKILEEYNMYVIPSETVNIIFIARDVLIDRILP